MAPPDIFDDLAGGGTAAVAEPDIFDSLGSETTPPGDDLSTTEAIGTPATPDRGRLRGEAFRMLNDAERLSPRLQRDVADESSGVIGGAARGGKNVLGAVTETLGETFRNPFTATEAFTMNEVFGEGRSGKVADDLREARDNVSEWFAPSDPEKTRQTIDGFIKFFEGNGITDGKEMMTLLRDSVRENLWDPTSDDDARQMSDGTLRVNPKFVALPDAREGVAAIERSTAAPEAKEAAKQGFLAARKTAAAEFDRKARGYDEDYRRWAERKEAEGVTDPEQIFYSWPGLDRNWVESSWDVVRDTVAEAGRGTFRTIEAMALPVAGAMGSEEDVARISRNLLESSRKSQFSEEIAAARGQGGAVTGTLRELGSTVGQMAPMFAGAGAGRLIAGGAEASAGRALLGKAVTGGSIYGWAGAQGYGSIMQTALQAAERKAAEEGRDVTDAELVKAVEDNQGAAVANGLQTAILAKLMPQGTEAVAASGLRTAGMTGREVATAFRQRYGNNWKDAIRATAPELKEFAKDAYKAAKVGFTDEAIEEGVNQFIEGAITKLGGVDAGKTWDEIGQETWTGAWMGGVIGGSLPVARQTLAARDPADLMATRLAVEAAQEAPLSAAAAVAPVEGPGEPLVEGAPEEAPVTAAETTVPPVEPVVVEPVVESEVPAGAEAPVEPATGEIAPAEAEAPVESATGEIAPAEAEAPVEPAPVQTESDLQAEEDEFIRSRRAAGTAARREANAATGPVGQRLNEIEAKWEAEDVGVASSVMRDGSIELTVLRVPENRRRQGIGSRVLDDLKQLSDETGTPVTLLASDLDLTGSAPEAFYERNGFTPTGGGRFRYDPQPGNAPAPVDLDETVPEAPPAETPVAGEAIVPPEAAETPVAPEPAEVSPVAAEAPAIPEPAAAPVAPAEGQPDLVSTKNAATDEMLLKGGFAPIATPASKALQTSWDEALAIAESDPGAGSRLVEELNRAPRALANDVENGVLLKELADRKIRQEQAQQAFFRAVESGDQIKIDSAKADLENARTGVYDAITAAKKTGTAWGRSGRFRQLAIDQDYSLTAMEALYRAEVNDGKPLTAKQQREVAELSEKLRQAQERVDSLEGLNAEQAVVIEKLTQDVERAMQRARARDLKSRSKLKAKLDPMVAAAKERLAARGRPFQPKDEDTTVMRSGLAPEDLENVRDMAIVGAGWLVDRSLDLGEFTVRLTQSFGDWARDLADAVFKQARQIYHESAESVRGREAPSPAEVVDSLDPELELTRRDVWDLARAHVIAGQRGNNVLDAVFGDLSPIYPELTREQVATLFTDYGKVSYPSKDEATTELNRVRNLERTALKILDLKEGRAPKRTGFQRGEQDVEVRALEKEFRDLLKESGIRVEDPERQLQSALGAAKRRMRNEIEEIERAIARGERRPDTRATPVPFDEEAVGLKARLEKARKDYAETFGTGMTIEKRVAAAIKTLDRQIAEEDKMLAEGITRRPKGTPVPETPEIAERRRILQEKRDARKALDAALNPKPKLSPEEARLKRFLGAAKRRREELERRLRENDLTPKPKPLPLAGPEVREARIALDKLKREFNERVLEAKLANRTPLEKFTDGVRDVLLRFPRAIMTSADIGGFGRQGGLVNFTRPGLALKNFPANFAFTEKAADRYESAMESDPDYPQALASGLSLTSWRPGHKLDDMEEVYRSRIAKKFPGVKQSERAYVTYLNTLRMSYFKLLYRSLASNGQASEANLKMVAKHVNAMTGRGFTGKWETASNVLADIFFSPKYWWSRIQALSGLFYHPADALTGYRLGREETKAARKLLAKEYARLWVGAAAFYSTLGFALSAFYGDDDEDKPTMEYDPRSSDFGKLKFPNGTRVDFGAGMIQNIVFISRILSGKTKSPQTGEVIPIAGEDAQFGRSRGDEIMRMIRTKLAPVPGAAMNVAYERDLVGNPVFLETELAGLYMPISFAEIYAAYKELGPAAGTAASAMNLLGFGTSTYGDDTKEDANLEQDIMTGLFRVNPERYEKE